ncbi:DUF3322 domain-containing protein [Arthrobacter sp. TWP1-1]|uniref:DUF3322 domain-containing protein n=1 Tax=Arthrobacter sp. TWP1-1 TaxID=2804568 RepID=UPI003CF1A410
MKSPETVAADIRRRLTGKWHADLVGEESGFPHAFPLGRPSASDLRADYAAVHAQTVEWQDWARKHGVIMVYESRAAKGRTTQTVPTHVRIASIDQAAAIVANEWPERLARARQRLVVLLERYPHVVEVGRVLRLVDTYSTVDFELLLTVTDWYLEDPARAALGVTPRQVPIPGVHAKWLQSHRAGVQALTGLDDLGLLPGHPSRIHFTYLDPEHLEAGERVHDSATAGDSFTPAYLPEVVVISENKDTAIHFPSLGGGISVEGVGKGGKTPASFSWIRNAPVVVYWGDIDRDGYEILNGYRVDFERDIDSILMGTETYETYEEFGTNLDQNGKTLEPGFPKPVDKLRTDELVVYLRVLDAQYPGNRRVEQERIPLTRALEAVKLVRKRWTRRDDQ